MDSEVKASNFTIENDVLKGSEPFCKVTNDYNSLGKFVLDRLKDQPHLVGQIDTLTHEVQTYEKMRERSVRCALWMKSQGLVLGDVVAICSNNTLDVAMPCYGALYLGVAFYPWDTGLTSKNFQHLMNTTKPKMVFVCEELVSTIVEAANEAELDATIIVFGGASGLLDYESVIAEPGEDEVEDFECTPIERPEEIAVIMSTSGSTGLPKSVALSHGGILKQLHQSDFLAITDSICLIYSPLSWLTSMLSLFMSLYKNIARLIAPPFEEDSACKIIEELKVDWVFMAPNMIKRLLNSGSITRHDFSSVKHIMCGGSPLSVASQEALAKVLPNVNIYPCYGSTELGGCVSISSPNSKLGSVGLIAINCQLKVVDPNNGQKLGVNQRGEFHLKAPTMMNFYYNNPEATASAIDEKGWLHSGDLGYYDEDGEVFIVDRLKELIKYRGFHVSPFEIETILSSHPGVADVAVVGMPHPVDDEHPLAFVVRAPEYVEVTEAELVDLVAAQVADTKRLRGGVKFIDRIPRTSSNKIQRHALRNLITL
ncbi:4-coumarate--CoA ligase 1-like [Athalia rosae]|uniref:4-coumarate--CoA ligase 1-like n=1 Tax=Athalia rosae TaxID=37344 RepID=UPI0020331EDD|nr:4-coumarate--CoA ligase 1-like [Athalia rosae]